MNQTDAPRATLVSNIQRYSIHDGGGIRTTVFLKGCPLRCFWCANPENQLFQPETLLVRKNCKGCLACVAACPSGALRAEQEGPALDREKCIACGSCEDACLHDAIRVSGAAHTPEDVMQKVKKDLIFYRGKGGVTISGGEPLSFGPFCLALAQLCRENRVGLVFETCGHGSWETLRQYAEYAQGIFFDVKHADPEKHKEVTGADNRLILDNLRRLTDCYDHTTVRIPVIPGVNDTEDEMEALARCIRQNTGQRGVREVELLPFHNLGETKYQGLDRHYHYAGRKNMTKDEARRFLPLFQPFGLPAVVK